MSLSYESPPVGTTDRHEVAAKVEGGTDHSTAGHAVNSVLQTIREPYFPVIFRLEK
jgi:hypothetical protein